MDNYNIPKGNWKHIKHNEHYLISDDGKVFSLRGDRLLNCNPRNDGYIQVSLWVNNKGTMHYIHRLVLEHFCDSETNETVNHKDGNKSNNTIGNLEWMTYKENNVHAIKNGLNTTKHKRNKRGSKPVSQYDEHGILIKTYPSMRQAERETGVSATSIGHGIRKGWKYGGYTWKFANGEVEIND